MQIPGIRIAPTQSRVAPEKSLLSSGDISSTAPDPRETYQNESTLPVLRLMKNMSQMLTAP